MHSVFLHLTRRHLVEGKVAKKGNEVHAQPDGVAFGPLLAALTFSDDAILLEELIGSLPEGGAGVENTGTQLAVQGQIPFLGSLGGCFARLLLGAELARLPPTAIWLARSGYCRAGRFGFPPNKSMVGMTPSS